MINLREKAEEICFQLRKQGFKRISFDGVDVQDCNTLEDFEGDVEAHAKYHRDHAYFEAVPRYPSFDIDEDEYTEAPSFNERKFEKDLVAWIREQMGDDVEVNYRPGCNEFECIRVEKK